MTPIIAPCSNACSPQGGSQKGAIFPNSKSGEVRSKNQGKVFRALTPLCLILCLFALGSFGMGCGKVGDPVPPDRQVPASIRGLTAKGKIEGIELVWFPPIQTTTGKALKDLDTFLVKRTLLAPISGGIRGGLVENLDTAELRIVKEEEIAEVRFDNTRGLQAYHLPVVYLDRSVEPGRVYEYTVQAVSSDDDTSNIRSLVRALFRGTTSEIRNF